MSSPSPSSTVTRREKGSLPLSFLPRLAPFSRIPFDSPASETASAALFRPLVPRALFLREVEGWFISEFLFRVMAANAFGMAGWERAGTARRCASIEFRNFLRRKGGVLKKF